MAFHVVGSGAFTPCRPAVRQVCDDDGFSRRQAVPHVGRKRLRDVNDQSAVNDIKCSTCVKNHVNQIERRESVHSALPYPGPRGTPGRS